MNKLNKQLVTDSQLTALNNVQANVGRTWKSSLLESWSNGNYQYICFDRDECAELQTLRNLYGPCWLSVVTSKELKAAWVALCNK